MLSHSDDTANPLGSGQDTVYDRVEFAYNRLGQVIEKTDQNGTVHEFTFDGLGRQTSDKVTTVGTGIDDAVLRLSTTFEKRGMPEKLSSYDADTGGNVVNEVKLAHNDFGQLVTEYQEHEGAVNTSTTPTVAYTYPDGSGGHTRLQKMTYPNGRVLRYEYNTGLDDAMNRVSYLADDDNGSVGTHLADYSYLGAGTIACEDFCQPQVRLDRDHGTAGEYAGWDRFGRVVDHLWRDYGASADRDRYTHGYDRTGNRLYRENTTTSGKDEFYTYDGVNQLTAFDRGDLNLGKTAITGTPGREQDFTLDPTGNWTALVEKTNGTTDLNQSRAHNVANELAQIDAASTHVAHDDAGNMTKAPKPDDWDDHFDLTFDAWNRLVRVADSAGTVAIYEYDARNFRVAKLSYTAGMAGDIRSFYFNSSWQCLEDRVETGSASSSGVPVTPTIDRQYVWSLRYIDDLILRDRDTTADGTLDERIYYLNDANFNITALVDTNGDALERYVYDPYGTVTIYTGDWSSTRSTSNENNQVLYTGRRLDVETGLYYYRARYYSAELGRFMGRDPIRYDRNLYQYCGNRPETSVDPFGLKDVAITAIESGGDLPTAEEWMIENLVDNIMKNGGYPDKYREAMIEKVAGIFKQGCIGITSMQVGDPTIVRTLNGDVRGTVPNVEYCYADFADAAAEQKRWDKVDKCKCTAKETTTTGAPGRARIFAVQYSSEGVDPKPDGDGRYDLASDPKAIDSVWWAPRGDMPFDFFFFSEQGDPWYNPALPWIHATRSKPNMVIKAADNQGLADQLSNSANYDKMFYCVACAKKFGKMPVSN